MIWRGLIVHHSAGTDHPDTLDYASILRYHTDPPPAGRGWTDIGYHWLVEKVGSIYVAVVGRNEEREGAHCIGRNWTDLGLCFVGDFTLKPPPTEALEVAAERVIRPAMRRYGFKPTQVTGHGDHWTTECPGRSFNLDALRAML